MPSHSQPLSRRFPLHGLELAALESPGGGLPVIALHGWLDNAASFLPLAPLLNGVHLLALDLPGHGHSSHLPASAGYHLADNCRWIAAVADAMGWERFVLMGHSMGAGIASIAAAAMPERVCGLVLLDGLGPLAYTTTQAMARLQRALSHPLPTSKRRTYPSIDSAIAVRQRLGRFPIGHAAAQLILERGMRAVDGGFEWRHDERLNAPGSHYYTEEQAEAVLRAIACPALLISATDGAFRDWAWLVHRKACIAHLQHQTLPGGHHLHMESPAGVAELIQGFLKGVQENATSHPQAAGSHPHRSG